MPRCGWCKKFDGDLYAVFVASRGKRFRSYAHADCAVIWSAVSNVRVAELVSSLLTDSGIEVKRERVVRKRIITRAVSMKHCALCSKILYNNRAKHCKRHARQVAWQEGKYGFAKKSKPVTFK